MNFKKLSMVLLVVLIFTSFSCAAPKPLKIHFIDVGQADCILIQTPNNKTMLVDAGVNPGSGTNSNSATSYLASQKVTKIDILVATVPRKDHIGALEEVINNYQIDNIYMPRLEALTKIYKVVMSAIKAKKLTITWPTVGSTINLDPSIKIEVLAPNSDKYNSFSDYSIVLRITYGKTSFLLTGDAENVSEVEMLKKGYNLKADVLKVGSHGFYTSTSPAFLKAVSPKYGIISAGKNNYELSPSPEIIKRLQESGVTIFRTDLDGSIIATSEGQKIKFEKINALSK